MSKLIGTHNGIESDSVNAPVNFTTGLQVDGVDVVPAEGVASVQAAPDDVTAVLGEYTKTAITDPADTPADADALRDDLVANALADIDANFDDIEAHVTVTNTSISDLQTAVNSIIAKLVSAGIFSA
jgi:hypothetical protein